MKRRRKTRRSTSARSSRSVLNREANSHTDPLRKFKGRTVFQGNNVKDENNDTALFSELGSSPATMEAGKTLDAYGHMPGNVCRRSMGCL